MNKTEMDQKTLLINSILIPFAVIAGTSIAILAHRSLESTTAMIVILIGVIIKSFITYIATKPR
jgi:hypothetical protein